MKIKELHLRNIASIEKADINFENGLNDAVTGQPSPIFLISGDTGTGKSVLLDGISMALFKNTPRLKDVSEKTNNRFIANNGEPLDIFSLKQYTRLGISEKDDCYSELVFDGNDGLEYTVRLSLGMKRKNKKGADGQYLLDFQDIKWRLRCGNEEWDKEADIKPRIDEAIGLTFEQFNRMAMLAQGQFANFLCGKKDERTAILEQLTNTEQFTRYGTAIQSLFSKAKEEKKTAEALVAEMEKSIGNIDEDTLKQQVEEHESRHKGLKAKAEQADFLLQLLRKLEEAKSVKAAAEGQLAQLQETLDSEEYKQKKQLVSFWDTTEKMRREYLNLLSERAKTEEQTNRAESLKQQLHTLSDNLEGRIQQNHHTAEGLKKVADWLDERLPYDELFANSGTITTKMDNLHDTQDHIQEVSTEISKENGRKPLLEKELDDAIKEESLAEKTLTAKDQEILKKQSERDGLHPEQLNKDIEQATTELSQLQDLQHITAEYRKSQAEEAKLATEIDEGAVESETLNVAKEQAQKRYENAKNKETEALTRYSVMSSSVDETLTELRRRLKHTDQCPLCGQSLENHHFEEVDFQKILTPLEKERQQAESERKEAEKLFNEAQKKASGQEAKVKELQKRQTEQTENLKKLEDSIHKAVTPLSLTFDDSLNTQIQNRTNELQVRQNSLKDKQKQAEDLQLLINQLQKEKTALADDKNQKTQKVSNCKIEIGKLTTHLQSLETQLKNHQKSEEDLTSELDQWLNSYSTEWKNDIQQMSERLKKEAADYLRRKEKLKEEERKLKDAEQVCAELSTIRKNILAIFPDWEAPATPQPSDIQEAAFKEKWQHLKTQASILNNEQITTQNNLRNHEETLNHFYQENNSSETALAGLIAQENEIGKARNSLTGINNDISLQQNTITVSRKTIEEILTRPDLDEENLPDIEELESHKKEIEAEKEEALTQANSAKEKLNLLSQQKTRQTELETKCKEAVKKFNLWSNINNRFGGKRFRTLVQSHILKPLLNNANIYLTKITDRYTLTCSEENDQLAILVLDRYNKNEIRSATVLSGGERFMISLALSLALSSLNRPDLNINILFIDEGFGTLDEHCLDSVMQTLERLQDIAGQQNRRVGIISHREELIERIPTQIQVKKRGEGRSVVEITGN